MNSRERFRGWWGVDSVEPITVDHVLTAWMAAYRAGQEAMRERAAEECDKLTFALDHGGNEYRRPAASYRCAAAIRALPVEDWR